MILEVANRVTAQTAAGIHTIDEWLEARGLDPEEMRDFMARFGGDGQIGLSFQIGFEVAAEKFAGSRPTPTEEI